MTTGAAAADAASLDLVPLNIIAQFVITHEQNRIRFFVLRDLHQGDYLWRL